MTTWRRTGLIAMVAATLATSTGCAGPSEYRPTEELAGTLGDAPAARYPVPPESPRGDVRVASRGVVSVQPAGGGHRVPMIQIRLVVSNDNDTGPWTFDVREQRLTGLGATEQAPVLVSGPASTDPRLVIAPRQQRSMDLYFRSPGTGGAPPVFDLLWVVHTPLRAVAERTPFEEHRTGDRDVYAAPTTTIGLGPTYWYDAYYYPAFAVPPAIYYAPGPRWYPTPGYRGVPHWPRVDGVGGVPPPSSAAAPATPAAPNVSAPLIAPPVPAQPSISAPALPPAPALAPPPAPAPAPPPIAAPPPAAAPAPPVPSQPNISAPAPR
jgi:hypothetical protein